MKELIQWFASYPAWVKVLVLVCMMIIVVLLVFFRGETRLESDQNASAAKEAPSTSGINIAPGSGGSVTIGEINQTIIQATDPPEVKQQKIKQAKQLIAQEIIADIAAIDSRLGYVSEAMKSDAFEEKLQDARRKVSPSTSETATSGYRRLIAEARISSLRQTINSSPLRADFNKPLTDTLISAGIDAKPVRNFYDQIAEVQWATESLFGVLSESTRDRVDNESNWLDYYARRVTLAVGTLQQRSEGAYLAGLSALHALGAMPADVAIHLASLQHLEPLYMPDETMLKRLLKQNLDKMESLIGRKKLLEEEGRRLLQKEVDDFTKLNESLEIKTTDTWSEVVGKAISLRQFGRIPEAMAAFNKYSKMFSANDETAEAYANTAMAFTQQIKSLGVKGGVYVFQILEKSAASEAGLKVGDIIIEYDGKAIAGMSDIAPVLSDSREGEVKRITYLRLDHKTGNFNRYSGIIKGGALGAGIMPI